MRMGPRTARLVDLHVDGELTRREFVLQALRLGLAVPTVGALVAACTKSKSAGLPPPENLKGRVQILQGFSSGSVSAQSVVQQALIDAFVRLHPGVSIDVSRASGVKAAGNRLAALLDVDAAPDLVMPVGIAGISEFADRKVWIDLRRYFTGNKISLSDFALPSRPAAHAASYFGSGSPRIVGVPIGLHAHALAYNADLFARAGVAAPPTSWSNVSWRLDGTFLDTARSMTKPGQFGVGHFSRDLSFFGFGGARYNPTRRRAEFSRSGSVAGMQFAADLISKHRVQAPVDEEATLWRAGKVAMVELCTCDIGGPYTTDLPFELRLAALPAGPVRRFVPFDVDVAAITTASRNRSVAWAVLEFFALDATNEPRLAFDGGGAIPALARTRSQFADGVQRQLPGADPLVWENGLVGASADHLSWMPAYKAVRDLGDDTFAAIVDGKPASEAMPTMQTAAQVQIGAWFKRNKLPT